MNGGLEMIVYNQIIFDIESDMAGKKVDIWIIYEVQAVANYVGRIYGETHCRKKEFLGIERGRVKRQLGVLNRDLYADKDIESDKLILLECAKRLVDECKTWGKENIDVGDIQESIYISIRNLINMMTVIDLCPKNK